MDTLTYKWEYVPEIEQDSTAAQRLSDYPRNIGVIGQSIRRLFVIVLKIWFKVWNRLEVCGLENLKEGKSYMIASNHCSHLDGLAVMASIPLCRENKLYPAAAADYFFNTTFRSIFSAVVLNSIPLDRKSLCRTTIKKCQNILSDEGNMMLIFPEGTRSNNGEIKEFKAGMGLFAAMTGTDVIPVHISGTFDALPKGRTVPKRGKIKVTFGESVSMQGRAHTKEEAIKISKELREKVCTLK